MLFVAEAVTLAHVGRAFALAKALDHDRFEIHFACHPRFNRLLGEAPFPFYDISTVTTTRFLETLAAGSPLYDVATLRSYIEEDLRLIDELRPNVVVGDFRLSLSVSARLRKVPYATVTNAYWSPFSRPRFIVPELPITRMLGSRLGQLMFDAVRRPAFALHTRPLNIVRTQYHLPSLGVDLRRTYTDADRTLYADLPSVVPTYDLPPTHHYIGPVLWNPEIALPVWWKRVPANRMVVYVTLGSSGKASTLPAILQALNDLGAIALLATAERSALGEFRENAFVAEYLPGTQAANRADVVVCNGGSPTTMQALAAGKPVIGIATNLDQYLNMSYLESAKAGVLVRAGNVKVSTLRRAFEHALRDDSRDRARTLAREIAEWRPARHLAESLESLC